MKSVSVGLAVSVVSVLLLSGCGDSVNPGEDVVNNDSKIRLNEIDCHGTDWIEIVNVGDMVADISGWIVTDSLDKPTHFYTLPQATIIRSGGYLVVKAADTDREGFEFGIKCDDESVYLLQPDETVVDVTDVSGVPDGYSWGRSPDGTGDFVVTMPTQGSANIVTPDIPEGMFDPTVVNQFEITLGADAIAALTADPYEYVSGVVGVTVGDKTVSGQPVGVRLKSGYSFQPLTGKAAFKIKAEDYAVGDRVMGLKNFTLNNMVDDETMMHETLAYALFRAAGIPAPRTGYARVKVNGDDYGLYVLVENYDDQFTTQTFPSTSHLYEGAGDLYAGQIDKFDVEDGDELDTTDLETLMGLVAASQGTWMTGLNGVADLAEMTRMWAVELFIAHNDGYSLAANNFFLHVDDDGLFTMMPWGTDRTFVETPALDSCTSIMCATCMDVAACRSQFDTAMKSIPGLVATAGLVDLIASIESAIGAQVESDPRKPYTNDAHAAAVGALKSWISARSAQIAQ